MNTWTCQRTTGGPRTTLWEPLAYRHGAKLYALLNLTIKQASDQLRAWTDLTLGTPASDCVGNRMGHRTRLYVLVREKPVYPAGNRIPVAVPVASHFIDWAVSAPFFGVYGVGGNVSDSSHVPSEGWYRLSRRKALLPRSPILKLLST